MVHINKDLFKNEIVKDFIYQITDFFLIATKITWKIRMSTSQNL